MVNIVSGFVLAIAFNNLMLISYSGMGATFILSFVSGKSFEKAQLYFKMI